MNGIRYHLSKIVPMKFHTHYSNALAEIHACDWWQWHGRTWAVKDRRLA